MEREKRRGESARSGEKKKKEKKKTQVTFMFLSERCWCLSLSSSIVFSPLTFSVSLFFTLFVPYQVAEPLHLPRWHKPRLWLPAEAQQPADVRMDLFHLNLLHSATPLFGLHFVQSPLLCMCMCACLGVCVPCVCIL